MKEDEKLEIVLCILDTIQWVSTILHGSDLCSYLFVSRLLLVAYTWSLQMKINIFWKKQKTMSKCTGRLHNDLLRNSYIYLMYVTVTWVKGWW